MKQMEAVAEFSDRFKELIGDDSYTKVGEAIGVSKQTISAYVNGERSPKKPTIQVIALYYGVNPAWLIGLDAPKYVEGPTPVAESGPSDPITAQIMDIVRQMSPEERHLYLENLKTLRLLQEQGRKPDIQE